MHRVTVRREIDITKINQPILYKITESKNPEHTDKVMCAKPFSGIIKKI